ncbi:N-acetyltransferase family protein [Paenisporosarcina sp. NPDC076898]|uniref:GNAT family N-acetyltransferase n=1 Tax=unclassified Paenisporosarcina TaxID=2642018 RepID=UPI003D02AC0B
MIIRQIEVKDAEELSKLIGKVESESPYMLFEAGEREISSGRQRQRIESIKQEDKSEIFVAEEDNKLIGYLFAIGGQANRTKYSSYIVIGILNQYRGQGIGTKLFMELEEWALNQKIHRLELTVITKNEVGVGLYKKMGFEIEGIKRDSLYIDGEFVDEYYMSKLI